MATTTKLDNIVVNGVALWDCTRTPDRLSKKYQIHVTQLSESTVKELEAVGVNVKTGTGEKEDYGQYVTPRNGKFPPRVVDNDGNDLPPEEKIGNGSTVRVLLAPYRYKSPDGEEGIACGLDCVRVRSLVESKGGGGVHLLFED